MQPCAQEGQSRSEEDSLETIEEIINKTVPSGATGGKRSIKPRTFLERCIYFDNELGVQWVAKRERGLHDSIDVVRFGVDQRVRWVHLGRADSLFGG